MPPPIWIRLDAAERRRYWWRTGFVTLTFVGMAVAAGLTAPAAERWWRIGGVAAFGLLTLASMVSQGTGTTLLTSQGMEFRTLFRRRSVPWSEVTGVEKRVRTGRSGTWSDVRVLRVQGRALTVPGAFTARWHDRKFEAKLETVRQCRARADDS
ncbi:PH domain-containing protein [Streptomyces sp. SID10853]|uniref:PH domain-containing protein n=1 Tax=Streptomyces sp. SID10853 TaxID=2706028 RepID=UPI0031BA0643